MVHLVCFCVEPSLLLLMAGLEDCGGQAAAQLRALLSKHAELYTQARASEESAGNQVSRVRELITCCSGTRQPTIISKPFQVRRDRERVSESAAEGERSPNKINYFSLLSTLVCTVHTAEEHSHCTNQRVCFVVSCACGDRGEDL